MPQFAAPIELVSVQTIQYPGATRTFVTGMSESGLICGHYQDNQGHTRGYVLERGCFSPPISFPAASDTYVLGMNSRGCLVGRADPKCGAFLCSEEGIFTGISVPGSDLTTPSGINDFGRIVGTAQMHGRNSAFMWSSGECVLLGGPAGGETFASAINNAGQIAGGSADATGTRGFIYLTSSSLYAHPLAVTGSTVTYPRAINERGEIAGTFVDSNGVDHAFLLSSGLCREILISGATACSVLAITSRGLIAGHFADTGGGHAFVGLICR